MSSKTYIQRFSFITPCNYSRYDHLMLKVKTGYEEIILNFLKIIIFHHAGNIRSYMIKGKDEKTQSDVIKCRCSQKQHVALYRSEKPMNVHRWRYSKMFVIVKT